MTDRLRALTHRQMVGLCLAGVVAAALLDWFTGPDVQVLVLYLVPVLTAAWYAGPGSGSALRPSPPP